MSDAATRLIFSKRFLIVIIFMIGALLSPIGWTQDFVAPETHREQPATASASVLQAESDLFLSEWSDYDRARFLLGADFNGSSSHFRYDVFAGLSFGVGGQSLDGPVHREYLPAGNFRYAYGVWAVNSWEFQVGRFEANQVWVDRIGFWQRSNHIVRVNSFVEFSGGMTGLAAAWGPQKRNRLGLSLVELPSIGAVAELQNGRLVTRNRWAGAPLQAVNVEGQILPLVVSTHLSGGAGAFFQPGVFADFTVFDKPGLVIEGHLSHTLSRDLLMEELRGVTIVPDTNGDPAVAVANDVILSSQYESRVGLRARYSWGLQSLWSEQFLSREINSAASGGSSRLQSAWGWGLESPRFRLGAAMGFLRAAQTLGFFQLKSDWDWTSRLAVGLSSDVLMMKSQLEAGSLTPSAREAAQQDTVLQTALFVGPQITYSFARDHQIKMNIRLIQATSAEIYYYGSVRGLDHVSLGYRYAF